MLDVRDLVAFTNDYMYFVESLVLCFRDCSVRRPQLKQAYLRSSLFELVNKTPKLQDNNDNGTERLFGTEDCDTGEHSLFVCCLTSQQHARVSQGRICSDLLPH